MAEAEVEKLQRHLSLLRQEYVKLQNKLAEVEQKYNAAAAASGDLGEDSFVARLLKTVAELFDKELYSDLVVHLDGREVKAHKFVLATRSNSWGVNDLAEVNSLDFTGIPYEVGMTLMKWVYTDNVELAEQDSVILELMSAASKYKLDGLKDRCEKALMSSVNVRNCIRFYQTAEEIGAEVLKGYCSEIISNHWSDLTSEDFVGMGAPLLYKMFKTKTDHPLHAAIRNQREDVVFLYLIEYDAQLPGKLNEVDNSGDLPLDLALSKRQESIAKTLVTHKVNVDAKDSTGQCLLHKAIRRGDEFAADFLITHGAKVNLTTQSDETPLRLTAGYNPDFTPQDTIEGMARVNDQLLANGANPNAQDNTGSTPLHRAVESRNERAFSSLLQQSNLDLELKNNEGQTVLWLALESAKQASSPDNPFSDNSPSTEDVYGEGSYAARLIKGGSSADAVNPHTGDSLLHLAARAGNEEAALFLASYGANPNHTNNRGETPLHCAAQQGLSRLVEKLLHMGANPNKQTLPVLSTTGTQAFTDDGEFGESEGYNHTPLHLAIANQHADVVNIFLEHKANALNDSSGLQVIPDFNLKDSDEQTVLGLALWAGMHDVAAKLLGAGASINYRTSDGMTLLHSAVQKQDTISALFLLEHQADIGIRTQENETPLQLAIKRHLPLVVDALCVRGADLNSVDEDGNPPLWAALESGQEDIASTLVRHGCDATFWGPGPNGCEQTLLHRAIDENNESVGCFLVRSGCDVNSPRRPGPGGTGEEESRDRQAPLHLACSWGQDMVTQCLIEHNADINAKDAEGQAPIHVAIINQSPAIISLLLAHPSVDLTVKDRHGRSPFATAMSCKNNKAAQAILDREPTAAEQVDNKGRNFLHIAIQNSDIESVLFLISVHANVNSKVQDASQMSPLHLAVQAGSEIIVRNLLLAGANVNDVNSQKQSALHISASLDQSGISSVLLQNGVDFDGQDDSLNNALHIAVHQGHLNTARTLLTESQINAEAMNLRGQNPLHVLAQYSKDNAASIFDLFHTSMPEYPLDAPDAEGNTALMLAYMNGNGGLCRSIVRAGAKLGIMNKHGVSIFNAPVATKQLLYRILDMLSKEPPWCESQNCMECMAKFGVATRKHHCRHCGRILCGKCSSKMIPIIKYEQPKPIRVCDLCFEVLSMGAMSP
ncbi:rabankyrin-5-like [Branchiostoma floridae]|uniref:Rabankyrin-5-like n=1 Tax=Branchiostoma floridae TaxID=7739 RepID=A0A9J7N3A7_BRAFL|nr:rabankyrin-5-like [Branchiostoma floridae]